VLSNCSRPNCKWVSKVFITFSGPSTLVYNTRKNCVSLRSELYWKLAGVSFRLDGIILAELEAVTPIGRQATMQIGRQQRIPQRAGRQAGW
jgi:hypothetical protein